MRTQTQAQAFRICTTLVYIILFIFCAHKEFCIELNGNARPHHVPTEKLKRRCYCSWVCVKIKLHGQMVLVLEFDGGFMDTWSLAF